MLVAAVKSCTADVGRTPVPSMYNGPSWQAPGERGVYTVRTGHDMTPKRIVVTGGAGFLGSHLCEWLLASGAEVICLDNFFTGLKSNVAHLLSNSRFEIVRHDLVYPILLEVDQIYNLACPASPVHYQYNPVKKIGRAHV
jgi:hypothetical protein